MNPGSLRAFLFQPRRAARRTIFFFVGLALLLHRDVKLGAFKQQRGPSHDGGWIDVQLARDVENYEIARASSVVSVASKVTEALSIVAVSVAPVSTSGSSE